MPYNTRLAAQRVGALICGGKYRLLRVLGVGGMAAVYDAQHRIGHRVAVKILHRALASDTATRTRFRREGRLANNVGHPSVVNVIDDDLTEDGDPFLVLPLLEGETLRARLERNGAGLSVGEVAAIASELLDVLAAAHAIGIVHRDIKPENLFITCSGELKVLDFGVGQFLEEANRSDSATASGQAIGTPSFMSPEQAMGRPGTVDAQSDIWAVGATMFTLLSGRRVHGATMGAEALIYAATRPAPTVASVAANVPSPIAAVVDRALAFDKPMRWADARTMRRAVTDAYRATFGEELSGVSISRAPLVAALDPATDGACSAKTDVRLAAAGGTEITRSHAAPRQPDDAGPDATENRTLSTHGALAGSAESSPRTSPRARRARLFMVGVALLLGVGIEMVRHRRPAAGSEGRHSCDATQQEWAGVWDDATRAQTKRNFETANPSGGSATFDRVNSTFDEYIARWGTVSTESCLATRVNRVQSEEIFGLRADCLAQGRARLAAVTSVFRTADEDVERRAIAMSSSLDPVAACSDVNALKASGSPLDAQSNLAEVRAIRDSLLDAQAVYAFGDLRDALSRARGAVAAARVTNHGPTTAEALLVLAELLRRDDKDSLSIPILKEAFLLAEASGADATAVLASAKLAYVLAGPARGDEARMWLDIGRACLKRMGSSDALELALLDAEAIIVTFADRRMEEGLVLEERYTAGCRRVFGSDRHLSAALFGLGNSEIWLGKPTEARHHFEEAAAIDRALGGPLSVDVAEDEEMRAWALIEVGEFGEGEAILQRTVKVFAQQELDDWAAEALRLLAWAGLAKGETSSALVHAENARIYAKKAQGSSLWGESANVILGLVLTRAGRPNEALPFCQAALAAQEAGNEIYAEKPYEWDALRCQAEALVALGHGDVAIPYLERSLRLPKRVFPGDFARVEYSLARALVQANRDRARAFDLASAAQQELVKVPFLAFDAREVNEWVTARFPRQ